MNLTHLFHFFPHCNNSSANRRVRSKLENRDRLKSMLTATFVGKVRHIAKKNSGLQIWTWFWNTMQNKIAGMERSEEKSDKIGEQKVERRTSAAIIIAARRAAIITSLPLPLPPFFMISLPLPLPLPPFFMTSLPLPLPLPWKSRAAAAVRASAASRCPITGCRSASCDVVGRLTAMLSVG